MALLPNWDRIVNYSSKTNSLVPLCFATYNQLMELKYSAGNAYLLTLEGLRGGLGEFAKKTVNDDGSRVDKANAELIFGFYVSLGWGFAPELDQVDRALVLWFLTDGGKTWKTWLDNFVGKDRNASDFVTKLKRYQKLKWIAFNIWGGMPISSPQRLSGWRIVEWSGANPYVSFQVNNKGRLNIWYDRQNWGVGHEGWLLADYWLLPPLYQALMNEDSKGGTSVDKHTYPSLGWWKGFYKLSDGKWYWKHSGEVSLEAVMRIWNIYLEWALGNLLKEPWNVWGPVRGSANLDGKGGYPMGFAYWADMQAKPLDFMSDWDLFNPFDRGVTFWEKVGSVASIVLAGVITALFPLASPAMALIIKAATDQLTAEKKQKALNDYYQLQAKDAKEHNPAAGGEMPPGGGDTKTAAFPWWVLLALVPVVLMKKNKRR